MTYLTILQIFGGGGEGGGSMTSLIFMGLIMIVAFYFFGIMPQRKKAKQQKNFLEALGKGDKVITAGGIHGKIVKIDEHSMLIEVDTNAKLRVDKSSISVDLSQQMNEDKSK